MLKLRSLLTAGLILPLIAFGGALGAGEVGNASALPMTGTGATEAISETGGVETYRCCWVYYMGNWWCIPC